MRTQVIAPLLLSAALLLPLRGLAQNGAAVPPPASHYFLKCRKLIQPGTGAVIEPGVIEVSGGRVLRVGKAAEFAIPADAAVVDFGDKYVIPGLIETHAHLYTNLVQGHSSNELLPRLFLAGGITSVLDPGSFNPEGDFAIRDRVDSGVSPGPHFFLSGEYLQMSPPDTGMAKLSTVEEANLRIDRWADQGSAAIKIYNGMHGEILKAAIEHAHGRGLRVVAHIGAITYSEAIEDGIDVLYHGIYAMPELMPPGMPPEAIGMINTDFAPPEYDRFYKALGEANLHQPAITDMLKRAAAARVVFGLTIVALEPPSLQLDEMERQKKFYSDEAWKKVEKRASAPAKPFAKAVFEKNIEFARLAHEAGVPLTIGTDMTNLQLLPQFAFWREMEIFAKAGMSPMEVLKAATANGAFAIGRSDFIGSIAPGQLADFVVLNADPLLNIGNTRAVYRVVKDGTVYDPETLLKPVIGRVH
ncbi:MAG: amidohydrolase family protein [Terriglobales bacterium]